MWLKNDNRKLRAWLVLCLFVSIARADLETNDLGHVYIHGRITSTNPVLPGFWRTTNANNEIIRTTISAGTNAVIQDQGTNLIINVSSGADTGITNIINSFGTGTKQATNFAWVFSTGSGVTNTITTNTSTITVTYYVTNAVGGGGLTNELFTAAENGSSLAGPTNQPSLGIKTIVAGHGISNIVSTTTNLTLAVDSGVFAELDYVDATFALADLNLTAGFGLLGGGDLSADRTFYVNTNQVFTTNSPMIEIVNSPGTSNQVLVTYGDGRVAWESEDGAVATTNTISEVLTAGNNAGGLTMTNLGVLYMAGKIFLNGSSTIYLDLPNGDFYYGTAKFLDFTTGRLQLVDANAYIQENQLFGAGKAWEAHNFSGNTLPAFRGRTYGAGHAMSFLSNTTEIAYIDNFGRFTTRGSAAPTDALTPTNHVAIWFDSSAGAAFLCFKGRDASGTIVTNRIELNP